MEDSSINAKIESAADLLRAGGVVAFPTETVYGLGADASNVLAVRRIFEIKGRPADHPLIVHLDHAAAMERWAVNIPQAAWKLAEHFWPGPLTLILPRHPLVSPEVTGGQQTLGLRVPDHPLALRLLKAFRGGVAAPSANRFGRISPTTAQHVRDELDHGVDMVLDGGPCQVGLESTILSLAGAEPSLLRPGGVAVEHLAEVLGRKIEIFPVPQFSPRAPGMHPSHYAPQTRLQLCSAEEIVEQCRRLCSRGERGAVLGFRARKGDRESLAGMDNYVMPENPVEYARVLYATLRRADAGKYGLLLLETPPDLPEWQAVLNRLRRAAHR